MNSVQHSHSTYHLGQSVKLKSGTIIPNRIVKAAMHESMGDRTGAPRRWLAPLYKAWAKGGLGLSITGNVLIDSRAKSEPGNVIVEDERHLRELREWASAGSYAGTQLWMQINHPGKQAMRGLNRETIAPSAIPFAPELSAYFPTPREMTNDEIEEVIARFANTARIAKKAGFGGVQIHAAHGYLINQFLSPHHNRRHDKWGGSPENRRRFLIEVYEAIRAAVGVNFPIGIKLNSADFQKGGYDEAESMAAILAIADSGIDMIEISGGTYESPVFTGSAPPKRQSTQLREAFFLDFAEKVRAKTSLPLMVTGGFRTVAGMNEALESGAIDFIGVARLLSLDPNVPKRLLEGLDPVHAVSPRVTGFKPIDRSRMMEIVWYSNQLMRIARHGKAAPNESTLKVALCYLCRNLLTGKIGIPKFRAT